MVYTKRKKQSAELGEAPGLEAVNLISVKAWLNWFKHMEYQVLIIGLSTMQ